MAENKQIKATATLAKLYENQGLIADAIATYEALYTQSPTQELFSKLQELRHDFINSDSQKTDSNPSALSILLTKHEMEYFRILPHSKYLKYVEAHDPDTSDLDIKIELDDEEEEDLTVIEVNEYTNVTGEEINIPKPEDKVFQEVLENIEKGPQEELMEIDTTTDEPEQEMAPTIDVDEEKILTVIDLTKYLQSNYGDATLLKDIDKETFLNSITTFLK